MIYKPEKDVKDMTEEELAAFLESIDPDEMEADTDCRVEEEDEEFYL